MTYFWIIPASKTKQNKQTVNCFLRQFLPPPPPFFPLIYINVFIINKGPDPPPPPAPEPAVFLMSTIDDYLYYI